MGGNATTDTIDCRDFVGTMIACDARRTIRWLHRKLARAVEECFTTKWHVTGIEECSDTTYKAQVIKHTTKKYRFHQALATFNIELIEGGPINSEVIALPKKRMRIKVSMLLNGKLRIMECTMIADTPETTRKAVR